MKPNPETGTVPSPNQFLRCWLPIWIHPNIHPFLLFFHPFFQPFLLPMHCYEVSSKDQALCQDSDTTGAHRGRAQGCPWQWFPHSLSPAGNCVLPPMITSSAALIMTNFVPNYSGRWARMETTQQVWLWANSFHCLHPYLLLIKQGLKIVNIYQFQGRERLECPL